MPGHGRPPPWRDEVRSTTPVFAEAQDGPERIVMSDLRARPWMAATLAERCPQREADPAWPVGAADFAKVQDGPERIVMSDLRARPWMAATLAERCPQREADPARPVGAADFAKVQDGP